MRAEVSECLGAVYRNRFRVGGVSVQLAGHCETDVTLVPSLEPFRLETGESDIDIRVDRVRCLRASSGRKLFDSGTTWEVSESAAGLQFDFNAALFGDMPFKRLLIDVHFRNATLQLNEECLVDLSGEVEPLG